MATQATRRESEIRRVTRLLLRFLGDARRQFQTLMVGVLRPPSAIQSAGQQRPAVPAALPHPAPSAVQPTVEPTASIVPLAQARPLPGKPEILETTVTPMVREHPGQAQPAGPPAAALARLGRLERAQLDPLNRPLLHQELPGLATALDGAAMREHLQAMFFGKPDPWYTIIRCVLDKAIWLGGEGGILRYQIDMQDEVSGQKLHALVSGRVFPDQVAGARYMRDRLAPLAARMRVREEVAPFITPMGILESLNMVLHVFPIDGELPTLVASTDRRRMTEVFAETLPEVLDKRFTIDHCGVELVQYRRQHRCVLRYTLTGREQGGKKARRVIYGKVSDSAGAIVGEVMSALRQRVLNSPNACRFNIPRWLGFRPDLSLTLLEAMPGEPRVGPLLKARLAGAARSETGGLTLDAAIESCARIASTLHMSGIKLGRPRTLDDELAALRQKINAVRRIAPDLGARFAAWMERIDACAAEFDALRLCFCHGDFTHTQLMFDGTQPGLLDFDKACQAEPALDLGQFLAYLRIAIHKARKAEGGPAPIGEQFCARFLQTYIAASSDALEDAERLRVRTSIYEVASLLRMALHGWQQLKAERVENVVAVLEERMARLSQLDR